MDLIEQFGERSTQVQEKTRLALLISRLDLLTLYSIVVVTVAKPTARETLLFTIWAIVLALAAALVVLDHLREAARTPALG